MISFRTRYIIYICISVLVLRVATLRAQDWGVIKCADCTVNVRSERSEDSVIVLQLKPEDLVEVDFLEGSWWAVFKLYESDRRLENAIGYVYARLLKPVSQKNMRVWSSRSNTQQK